MMDFFADLTAFLISGKNASPFGSVVIWQPSCHLAFATVASLLLKSADLTLGAVAPRP